jgi:molecular chaperone IbpA
MARALDTLADEPTNSFPPYNIESMGEDAYRITMAVAGFGENDIEITARDATLVVSGRIARRGETEERKFLHRGIAERAFERRFNLAEHVVVTNAAMENGLLHINLVRELPEEKKPKKIAISSNVRILENQAA